MNVLKFSLRDDEPARTAVAAVVLLLLLVSLRSLVFIFWGQAHFDADQAILGLMAYDISRLHGLVLFFYGQKYLLGILDWLAAPLFLLFGPSVSALKFPLLLLNAGAIFLLFRHLREDARLKSTAAALCCLILAVPSVAIASRLVEAQGGNIEPILAVLLLWAFRGSPITAGFIAAIGYLNREFTLYGIIALFILQFPRSRSEVRPFLKNWAIAAIVAVVTRQVFRRLARISLNYFAISAPKPELQPWSEISINWNYFVSHLLPSLFGAEVQPLSAFNILSAETSGSFAAGLSLVVAVCAALILALQLRKSLWSNQQAQFPLFLILTGFLSALSFILFRIGVRDLMCVKYVLLFLFFPIGIIALGFQAQHHRRLLVLVAGGLLVWAASNMFDHLKLWQEYLVQTPRDEIAALESALLERKLKCGSAPYWTAYPLAFQSLGRLKVASSTAVRIPEFQSAVEQCQEQKFWIGDTPECRNAEKIERWYLCTEDPTRKLSRSHRKHSRLG
ncbi:MAG: hypothetical protein J0M12_01470 [Deltaproteobacteria bacterium]|nr:hypothetical protein [Deltaproteobacteria bacterium]